MAIFQVDRVWKGDVGPTLEIEALEGIYCISFPPRLLERVNELLVYAHKVPSLPRYITGECSRADLASRSKDYSALGSGRTPKAK